MKPVWILAVIWPLLVADPGDGSAARAMSLTVAERAMLAEVLGKGVVGAPVASATLTPAFAPLRNGTWTYQIVDGEEEGQIEQHVLKRVARDPSGASWRYAVGADEIVTIEQKTDGSLTFVSDENSAQGVITRYQPAEPGLLNGLAPGDSRSSSIAIEVFDLGEPAVVSRKGRLEVTYSYLGAYKVTTPAGTYDAALIKWSHKGKVGLANVDGSQYRFFAANVGMVASVDRLDVSAFLLYRRHSKSGKLLVQTPE